MRRLMGVALAALLTLNLTATVLAAGGPARFLAIPVLGIQTVGLDESFLDGAEGDQRRVFSAFVETGSLDGRCLATLSEANIAGIVKELYCAPRQVVGPDGRTMNGLFLHVFLNEEAPQGAGLVLNFYQERMVSSSSPIPCRTTQNGAC